MNELYIGTSKGFVSQAIKMRREQGHTVFCISSQPSDDPYTFTVDWKTVNAADIYKITKALPNLDLILFNQNSSSLNQNSFESTMSDQTLMIWKQMDHWRQSYFVSCQLPFSLIHHLQSKISTDTRVIWMLSSMIVRHQSSTEYADYIGNKYQNFLIMKNMAQNHTGCFFGIDPGDISGSDFGTKIAQFQELIKKDTNILSGLVWKFDGQLSDVTKLLG
jgi:hypothetical protein